MAVGTSWWPSAVVVILLIKNTQPAHGQAKHHPDCGYIKHHNHAAKSGVYTIAPPGSSPFKVYCDMSEAIGWTKILQIATPYTVTRSGFGKIATEKCFSAGAKLSDARINAIREEREKVGEPGIVHYRITAADTKERVYAKIHKKEFNDLLTAWNIFTGQRRQCQANTLQACAFKYKNTNWRTLDTLHDGTQSGQARRFFTDYYGGNTKTRCWNPKSSQRCIGRGSPFAHIAHYDAVLWIGK